MPYVSRNAEGRIVSLSRSAQGAAAEYLPASHPEVLGFIESGADAEMVQLALADSDAEVARVAEDLVQALIAKNLILFTDLPDAVQSKLLAREKLRSKLDDVQASILSEDDTI